MSVPVGGGLQVNKSEQVSSDDHQMSVAGVGPLQWWAPDVNSRGYPRSNVQGEGGTLLCDLLHDACDVTAPQQNDRHLWKHYLPATSLAGGKNSWTSCSVQQTAIYVSNTNSHCLQWLLWCRGLYRNKNCKYLILTIFNLAHKIA